MTKCIKRLTKNCLPLIISVFFMIPVFSFSNDFKFEHLTSANGLAGNSVSSIIQDKRGFLWFGTQDGLSSYDGKEFRLFEHKPFDDDSLPHNLIQTMFYDKEKDLIWIGTYGGLSSFDPKNGNIQHYVLTEKENQKKKYSRVIVSIKKGSKGLMWIGTLSGLISLNPDSGEINEFVKNPEDPFSLPDNSVRDIHPGRDGKIWIATYAGLVYYQNGRFNKVDGLKTEFPSNYIMDIEETDKGCFLIASWDGGISYLNESEKTLKTVKFPDNRLYFVKVDNKGHIWAGTWGEGLYYSENIESLLKSDYRILKNDKNNIYSVSNNIGYSFLNDKSGLIWIGTNGGGLNKLNPDVKDTRYIYSTHDGKLSIPDERIKNLFIDDADQLWIGSYSSGLYVFNGDSEKLERYSHNKNDNNSISSNFINEIFCDREKTLWIGTNDGLNKFDKSGKTFDCYYYDAENKSIRKSSVKSGQNSVPDIIYALYEDVKGRLWIGSYLNGVYIWDRKNNSTVHLHPENSSSNSIISDPMIFDIMDDKFGNVWIGTNFGLNIYNIKTGAIKQYNYNSEEKDGISNNVIMKIYRDSVGDMWIGTSGGGLCRYDYISDSFSHYTKENGLSSNNVTGISEDSLGNIIVTTNNGIAGINRGSSFVYSLASEFGLNNYELKGDIETDRNGNVYVSTSGAVFKTDTKKQYIRVYDPQVLINSFKLNNDDYVFKNGRNIFDPGVIDLSWGENSFSFNFVSLDYTSPLNNRYEYILEGFDKDWIASGTRNYANYTNIPPGKYTFKVKGTNSSGKWSKNIPSMQIVIKAAPFKSLYAYILYAAAILIIFYSITMILRGRESEKRLKQENSLKTKLLEANKELDRLVRIDPLTGAFNRHHFRETLENGWHLHRRFNLSLSIIMTDIDFFKNYNDTYGHVAGDDCLRRYTEILKDAVSRKTDSVFRYGGEEFIILLLDTDLEGASVVADKIREKLVVSEIKHSSSIVSEFLTVSMGIVSTSKNDYESADKMIIDSDRKLYLAKEHGRNTVIC